MALSVIYFVIIHLSCDTDYIGILYVGSTDSGARIIIGSVAGAIALLVVLISALVIVCCLISHTKGKAKGK